MDIRRRTAARRQPIDHLPDEIIELILSKCPVKSVVRFTSVSKSWLSIISHPRFSRIHRIERSKESDRMILLAQGKGEVVGGHIYLIRREENPLIKFIGRFIIESMLPYPSSILNQPLCSCNGLILFGELGNDHQYMLFNPSVRKYMVITGPRPHATPFPWMHHVYYDPTTHSHMIVFFNSKCYTVYSCNEGNWSEIKDLPCDLCRENGGRGVAVDGCLYGLVSGEILCFDTTDGNLYKLPQLDNVKRAVALTEDLGRLYFYAYLKDDDEMFYKWEIEKHGSFDMWVMDNKFPGGSRVLINMEKEKVVDFLLRDNVCSVTANYGFQDFELNSKYVIFPYFENLYMTCSTK